MEWQKKISDRTELRFWLANKKSLSKRVKNIARFEIVQVRPTIKKFLRIEVGKFKNFKSTRLYLREVMIYADGQPIMYARTVTPKINLRGFWGRMKRLKDNPLSDIVFEQKVIKRSSFAYRIYSKNDNLSKSVRRIGHDDSNILVSRQSVFDYNKKEALLTEVFFKSFEKLKFIK
ncbi:MAG: chorismate lyase [Methylophilales bacterium]|jgi:chorismate lyase|nr:chorismate lyase [Pseudomonadota bacterium]NQW35247.1 chorismate lyase [Methylophilales bacterium]